MDSVLLQIFTCFEGQTFGGKWSEISRQELSIQVSLAHITKYMSSSKSFS